MPNHTYPHIRLSVWKYVIESTAVRSTYRIKNISKEVNKRSSGLVV